MKKHIIALGLILLAVFTLAACSSADSGSVDKTDAEKPKMEEPTPEDLAKKVIEENLQAAEEENIEVYMNTLSKDIREAEGSEESVQQQFDNLDIDYEILDMNVKSATEDEVIMEVTQKAVAKAVSEGYSFNNHIVKAEHTLIKEDGDFKFASTEVDNDTIQFLDENGNPVETASETE